MLRGGLRCLPIQADYCTALEPVTTLDVISLHDPRYPVYEEQVSAVLYLIRHFLVYLSEVDATSTRYSFPQSSG